jgi:hypothetical protein
MSHTVHVVGREIHDFRGNPAIEAPMRNRSEGDSPPRTKGLVSAIAPFESRRSWESGGDFRE